MHRYMLCVSCFAAVNANFENKVAYAQKTHARKAQKHGLERLRFPTAEKTHGLSQKIQGTYFKISALYFKIYGLYFSPFQMSDKQ